MIVVRGRESGAYEGVGNVADFLKDGTFTMSIALVGEDVSCLSLLLFSTFCDLQVLKLTSD